MRVDYREVLPTEFLRDGLPTLSRDLLGKTGPALLRELDPILSSGNMRHVSCENNNDAFSALHIRDSKAGQKPTPLKRRVASVSREIQELESIIDETIDSQSTVKERYGRDLMQSLDALKVIQSTPQKGGESNLPIKLSAEISKARQAIDEQFGRLCTAFEHDDLRVQWLQEGRLWPCLTPITLLEQMRSTAASNFGQGMKESLVTYAISITRLQRLLRIEDAKLTKNKQRLLDEQKNLGHDKATTGKS